MNLYTIILDLNNPEDTFLAYKALIEEELKENMNQFFIIIDNGSHPINQEKNKSNFKNENFVILSEQDSIPSEPENLLIVLESNLGFTGGNNKAIDIAVRNGADYVLLFNNDAIPEENSIVKLLDFSAEHRHSIVGSAVMDYYNHEMIQTLGTLQFGWKGYQSVPRHFMTKEHIKVGAVSGCCMLIPCKLLSEIGFFDDDFYLYVEENELSYRAYKAGYTSYVLPAAKIFHKGSATLGKTSNLKFYYLIRNIIFFHRKHSKTLHVIIVVLYQAFVNLAKNYNDFKKIKTLAFAIFDALFGNMGKCKRDFK